MSEYKPTIGLEIHAELNTKTKMFCNSKNDPDETRPNVNVCPVCMAHPGTLPVINKEAVRSVLKVGYAIDGEIASFTEFDRKNYFYPDIPKGYQISQYKYPLVKGGVLSGVEVTRIHLEEDTARSQHDSGSDESLVDFNRAGVPLMELVTEPVIHSAEDAARFGRELQLLLRTLGVSDANMEKGEMRIEANISVSKTDELGTKVEVKNLNSFKVAEKAIAYEIKRHIEALENGEELVQETRGWDDITGSTFSQRKKEGSADYRYFPDPDLPKLDISQIPEFSEDVLRNELPELPWVRRERYLSLGLKKDDADMYVALPVFGDFMDSVLEHLKDSDAILLASNYVASDVAGYYKNTDDEELSLDPKDFSELIRMVKEGELSSRGAKDTLIIMFERGGNPKEIAEKEGLLQVRDEGALKRVVEEIIAEHSDVAEEYRGGKEKVLGFLVGQGMRKMGGSADPNMLESLIKEALS